MLTSPRRFALISLLASAAALGQSVDLDRFNVDPAAGFHPATATGLTLRSGEYSAGLLGHYQFAPRTAQSSSLYVFDRLEAQVQGAYGITDRLQVGLAVPFVVYQNGQRGLPAPGSNGLGTPVVSARYGILQQQGTNGFDLAGQLAVGLPIGSSAAFARNSSVSVAPEVSAGRTVGSVRFGGAVNALIRPQSSLAFSDATRPAQSEVGLSGTLTSVGEGLNGELSARVAMGLEDQAVGAELLMGIRGPIAKGVQGFLLAGPGGGGLVGTPSFRVLAGLAYGNVKQPAAAIACEAGTEEKAGECVAIDSDHDGINDKSDQCVNEPEDKDGFKDDDGCADPDNDGDGVKDTDDKCPTVAANTADGCPIADSDKDGVPDAQDRCPNEPGFKEKQGCKTIDTDKDGIEDAQDRCPNEPGTAELKGCAPKDGDKDGVPDHADNCPTEAGDASNQGCPAAKKQLVAIAGDKIDIKDKVYFDSGKSTIQSRSFALLDQVASVLVAHPEITKLLIEGHTDNQGKADKNLKLSEDRAKAVADYLAKKGVAKDRLESKGFGQERPAASNDTAAGRDTNRRVEFRIAR